MRRVIPSKCLALRKCWLVGLEMGHGGPFPRAAAAFTGRNFFIAAADVSYCFPSLSLDLSSLGAIFYPLLFSIPWTSPWYVLSVTRLVSVHRREKDKERLRKGRGMSYSLPAACEMSPILSLPSPSKSLAEKGIAVAVVDSVSIHRVLVSNIPSTLLL